MKDSREHADPHEMLAAVRVNWRLWTILQAELLDPDCPLPDDVRGNVLSLAQFVDKHTLDVIAEPKPEKLDILIAINRELAGGLYTSPVAAENVGNDALGEDDGGGRPDRAAAAGDVALAVSA
jgi:flagellar protein FlaF